MLIAFLLMCLFSACESSKSKTFKTRAELIKYINNPENGLKKTDSSGTVKATFTYRPAELILPKQMTYTKDQLELVRKYQNSLAFVIGFTANGKEVLNHLQSGQYSGIVQTFGFRMERYIKAIPDGAAAVSAEQCLFLQTFGMGAANQLLVVFDKRKLIHSKKIDFVVGEFGLRTGDLHFSFRTEDLMNI
ncbi:hypothetical protein NAF19_27085 [Mucilaginibacter sp. RT5R15]|nr:hypothetical protein [Mucilaginibacter flavidus]